MTNPQPQSESEPSGFGCYNTARLIVLALVILFVLGIAAGAIVIGPSAPLLGGQ